MAHVTSVRKVICALFYKKYCCEKSHDNIGSTMLLIYYAGFTLGPKSPEMILCLKITLLFFYF